MSALDIELDWSTGKPGLEHSGQHVVLLYRVQGAPTMVVRRWAPRSRGLDQGCLLGFFVLPPSDTWFRLFDRLCGVPIDNIQASIRLANVLQRAGISTLEDLADLTEADFLRLRNGTRKLLAEATYHLGEHGLAFRQVT